MLRNRLVKVKSGYVPCKVPEIEKLIEAEMIRCFELALYLTQERRMKKRRFIEYSVSPFMYIS